MLRRRIMRHCIMALGLAVALVAVVPIGTAYAQAGWDSLSGNGPGGALGPPSESSSTSESSARGTQGRVTDPYEGAMKLMSQGNYVDALKVLKAIAAQTPDSEVALLQIGHCYIKLARAATNAETAQRDIDIGTGWTLEAATVGLRDAQEELVELYLDGKVFPVDVPEAGKWYLIWKDNRSDVAFGIGEFNRTLEKRLKLVMTPDDWRNARQRALDWQPAVYRPVGTSRDITQ